MYAHLAGGEDASRRAQQIRRVGGGTEVVAAADAAEQRDEVSNARHSKWQPLRYTDDNVTLSCVMRRHLHAAIYDRCDEDREFAEQSDEGYLV